MLGTNNQSQQALLYLVTRLDRTLSFKHLEDVRSKVTSRISLIQRPADTTWGTSIKVLSISTKALVFSATEPLSSLCTGVQVSQLGAETTHQGGRCDHHQCPLGCDRLPEAQPHVPSTGPCRSCPSQLTAKGSHPCLDKESQTTSLTHPAFLNNTARPVRAGLSLPIFKLSSRVAHLHPGRLV